MSSSSEATGYDVFLSHGSPDKPSVRTLADLLTQAGLRVYLDERELQPADNWVAGLNAGIQHSRFLVLVITPHTLERPWVETEWTSHLAFHGPTGRLIPVLLRWSSYGRGRHSQ
jgi:TIR domain-containing protein